MTTVNLFSIMLLGTGVLFILISIIEYFFPHKKGNRNGFYTKLSNSSEETWVFAQKYYAKMIFFGALFCVILSFLGPFFPLKNDMIGFGLALGILIFVAIVIYIRTQKAIKDKF
jgi:uncharacterized membrane protein